MSFTRTIENFTCEHCGAEVRGSGYTNHCPQCLWSKHVDDEPGDRAESCYGAMKPIAVEGGSPDYILVHQCMKCGIERRNKVSVEDNTDTLTAVAKAK